MVALMAARSEPPSVRSDGLQIADHRALQDRIWIGQRVGWACLVLIVLLALAGMTGRGGVWAERSVAGAGGIMVLPNVSRRGAAEDIRLTLAAGNSPHEVVISPEFLRFFDITGSTPEADQARARGGALVLTLMAEGPEPAGMTLHGRARRAGFPCISLTLDGTDLRGRVVILP